MAIVETWNANAIRVSPVPVTALTYTYPGRANA